MAKGFKQGAGGGNPLNFRIFGGTAAPASPKENDIWVNTDTEITSWVFAAENPYIVKEDIYASGTITSGYFVNKETAAEVASGNFSICTVDIPSGTSTITIAASSTETTSASHAFYDSDGNLISTVLRKKGTVEYEVPAGTASVRASFRTDDRRCLIATCTGGSEGAVWIFTGITSNAEFNALRKNGITVYPISAKQYVSGAWVDVIAMSYQGGTWVSWVSYLFNKGTVDTELTGGIYGTNNGIGLEWVRTLITPGTNRNYTTKRAVDISNYSKLKAKFTSTGAFEYAFFRIFVDNAASDGVARANSDLTAYTTLVGPYNGRTFVVELDLTSLTHGSYFIGYGMGLLSTSYDDAFVFGTVTEWWFE